MVYRDRVPLESLTVSEYNVRQKVDENRVRELAENIAQVGLLNDLIVIRKGERYEIICGRIRFEALKYLKKSNPSAFKKHFSQGIPVKVYEETELSPEDAMILSLTENVQQHTMTKEELARAVHILSQRGLSLQEIQRRVRIDMDELKAALELYNAVRAGLEVVGPGRPKKAEKRKAVTRRKLAVAAQLARFLDKKGIVNEDEFRKTFIKETSDLSSKEVQQVARLIKEKPERALDLKKVIQEIRKQDFIFIATGTTKKN